MPTSELDQKDQQCLLTSLQSKSGEKRAPLLETFMQFTYLNILPPETPRVNGFLP